MILFPVFSVNTLLTKLHLERRAENLSANQRGTKRKRNNSPECNTTITENANDADTVTDKSFHSVAVQTESNIQHKLRDTEAEKRKLRLKLWRANVNIRKLELSLQDANRKLEKYKNKYYEALSAILNINENDPSYLKASMLLDLITNFQKKYPRWSESTVKHCVIWQYASPKGYRHARNYIFDIPSKSTLSRYVGYLSCDTGITPLIKSRLLLESNQLHQAEKLCSLIVDEMSIKQQLIYDKKLDSFFGE